MEAMEGIEAIEDLRIRGLYLHFSAHSSMDRAPACEAVDSSSILDGRKNL